MRPRVGISRCLLGEGVRYDGGHKRNQLLLDRLGPRVEWVPVCPEVEVGMGTPRESIQLVSRVTEPSAGLIRLVGAKTGRDWTEAMADWTSARIADLQSLDLSGYVLKADSPSCGPEQVAVLRDDGVSYTGRGVFARALIEAFPDLPIEDERRLEDPGALARFIDRVFAYRRSPHPPCSEPLKG